MVELTKKESERIPVFIVIQHLFNGDTAVCSAHRTRDGADRRANNDLLDPEYGHSVVELTLED